VDDELHGVLTATGPTQRPARPASIEIVRHGNGTRTVLTTASMRHKRFDMGLPG